MSTPGDTIGPVIGSVLVLICLCLILFGVFFAQVYFYWLTYEADPRIVKGFVFLLWILESVHTMLCIHVIYYYLVTWYGDPINGISRICWSAELAPVFELLIVAICDTFYVHRIWHLSKKSTYVTAVPTFLLFARTALGCASNYYPFQHATWADYREDKTAIALTNAAFSLGAITDVVITSLMCYFLYKRRTSFTRTNRKLETLMQYSVSSGGITMICSICIVAALNGLPSSLTFGGLIDLNSKLYANCALVLLNSRRRIRKGKTDSLVLHSFPSSLRQNQDAFINMHGETASDGTNTKPSLFNIIEPAKAYSPKTDANV